MSTMRDWLGLAMCAILNISTMFRPCSFSTEGSTRVTSLRSGGDYSKNCVPEGTLSNVVRSGGGKFLRIINVLNILELKTS